MSSRSVFGTMAAAVILTCLAAYLYGFKKPLQDYKLLKSETKLLEAKVTGGTGISRKLQTLQNEIDELTNHLKGQTPNLSNSQMVAHVISRLDTISAKHAVHFLGVKPSLPGTVKYFEELPFAIEVSGNYFSLFDWLQEVERELGPMVVKKIDIEPIRGAQEQKMQLNMVSYRLK
ncbi:MAG: type 4a pilus biogenesis protein PilO [Desulfobulbales bacterium]|nr:type 4a pilus biogenesis protein PilO [Desulfobulbales bacterium]